MCVQLDCLMIVNKFHRQIGLTLGSTILAGQLARKNHDSARDGAGSIDVAAYGKSMMADSF